MAKKKSDKEEIQGNEEIKKLEKEKNLEEQSKITPRVHHKRHPVEKKEEHKPEPVVQHRYHKHQHVERKEQSKPAPVVHHHKKHKHKLVEHHHAPHISQAQKKEEQEPKEQTQKTEETQEAQEGIKIIKTFPMEEKKLIVEKEIAMDFAAKVQKKFDRIVKASILFGSQATNNASPGSDIDIILIIDDASLNWDLELISWYREELSKLIAAQNYPRDLHINTIKLTTWWQDLIQGDPVVINVLRYGEALVDSGGFFNPLKALLLQGKMRSTPEAVYNALQRAPAHLIRSKLSILNSIEGIYWTMIDAAQAALITAGKLPPSPEYIPQMMKETFVDAGLLKIDKIRALREIYVLHKGITHREINEVKGEEIDRWQNIANSFLLEMTRIVDKLLEMNREKK